MRRVSGNRGRGLCVPRPRPLSSSSSPGKSPLFGAGTECVFVFHLLFLARTFLPSPFIPSLFPLSPTPFLPLSFFQARSVEAAPKNGGGHAKTTTRAEYDYGIWRVARWRWVGIRWDGRNAPFSVPGSSQRSFLPPSRDPEVCSWDG